MNLCQWILTLAHKFMFMKLDLCSWTFMLSCKMNGILWGVVVGNHEANGFVHELIAYGMLLSAV